MVADMLSEMPMDRVICGDVGFGKTEVAMRAAFIATSSGKQVVVLVPTTLLARQHEETFKDRFANTAVSIASISRFKTRLEQKRVIDGLITGKIDIVVGTHSLLQENINFSDLGLLIIDEEHRFGVRQKEKINSLRAGVDILTMTATPIPRTLNMAISGLRDLSIIATPPERRLSIKTFIKKIRTLGFKVMENPLSTQIFGEYDTLMSCIQKTIKETFEEESFVMLNMKIVKGDRSKYVPSF